MIRYWPVLIFILAAFLTDTASADDRRYLRCPQGSGYDCPPPAPLRHQRAIQTEGIFRWCYIQESGRNILPEVAQALDEFSRETNVWVLPDCSHPLTSRQIATGGSAFIYGTGSRPGCGLAALACLPEYGYNVDVVYDASSMLTWTTSRAIIGTALHEIWHAVADAGEMYIHTGGTIRCSGKWWTIMDCGPGHALFIQDFDRETFRRFHYPAPVRGAALVTNLQAVLWAASSPSSVTVRIWADNLSVAEGPACLGGGWVCGGVVVPILPQTCYWAEARNAIYSGQLVFAGCTP